MDQLIKALAILMLPFASIYLMLILGSIFG
jgi:hypothetical protein